MSTLTAISLFTGAGGLDYGFEAAGFRTAVALEMDPRCCATLRHNRPWTVIEDDLARISSSEILNAAGLKAGEPSVLIGGPPCQPFSKSGFWATGDAKRLQDPRATTMEGYLRVLAETRPRAFLLENVEGLGFRGKDEGLQLIQAKLSSINEAHGTRYRAAIATLNAADFGVPQMRKRIFVVGFRDGAVFQFPSPTHGDASEMSAPATLARHLTAWDALYDLPDLKTPATEMKGKWADLLPTIPEGHNYLWHTDRGGGLPLFGWRRRYWSFLLKLARNQPSWTIQAQPGPATGPFHWDNRRLTMREMARLQTFPDDVEILGSLADAQKQLGNAVPSLLGEVIARQIAAQLSPNTVPRISPRLALRPAPQSATSRLSLSPVPKRFLVMSGLHEAHPGTGLGRRAIARPMVAAE